MCLQYIEGVLSILGRGQCIGNCSEHAGNYPAYIWEYSVQCGDIMIVLGGYPQCIGDTQLFKTMFSCFPHFTEQPQMFSG